MKSIPLLGNGPKLRCTLREAGNDLLLFSQTTPLAEGIQGDPEGRARQRHWTNPSSASWR